MQKFYEHPNHSLDINVGKIYQPTNEKWSTFSQMPVLNTRDNICYIVDNDFFEQETSSKNQRLQ